ncbi:MAG: hypothetical protein C4B59_12825 [Candidatus Methanogaster sp.]|uniref:Uncharacterized protein n=1 Tax=Candidatus Methanogaster sp. TaxID=3386292 RepID=A0AC61L001_9EURY|nr:MAG: hypothetical protein C4B59_12825 [ANME-2 cluster archaeon]
MIPKWMCALGISFISHMSILFVIIVVVTFQARDFDLGRTLVITAAYMAFMVVYFAVLFIVFKRKIDAAK